MSTFILSGKIIRQSNRQPIPKLYIEAWDKTTERKEPLVSTITDNDGVFLLTLDDNYIGEIYKDRYPDVFFKVYAGNTLLTSTETSLLVNLRGNTTDLEIAVDYRTTDGPKQVAYSVKGQILQKNFLPAAGCDVEVCDKGIVNDTVLAKVRTDEVGYFETRFMKEVLEKAGKQSPDLFLRISQGKDVRYTTAVKYNAATLTEFKEVIGGAAFPQESEFEMLNKKLGLLLRSVPVNEIRQNETNNPYKLLAQKTGNSEEQVKWMVMSQQVSAITQLPCWAPIRPKLFLCCSRCKKERTSDSLLSPFRNSRKRL
jgi:hypothetical protein